MSERFIPQFEPYWDNDEINSVNTLLTNREFLLENKYTREFEKEIAKLHNAKYCITVTSGTIALYMAMLTARKLLTTVDTRIPPLHSIFIHNAMVQAYLQPIVVDCGINGSTQSSGETFLIHNNGRLGSSYSLVEDCCQALGLHTKGKISCYSFASSKHITTLGQGGAICCDDDEHYEILCRLKDHGRNDRQTLKPMGDLFPDWGTNFKFTEPAAVFGLAQLKKLKQRQDRLTYMWKYYKDELKKYVNFLDEEPKWYIDIYVDKPQKLIDYMKLKNIGMRKYPDLTSNQDVYKGEYVLYPNAEYFPKFGVYLPSTTNISDTELERICSALKQFFTVML